MVASAWPGFVVRGDSMGLSDCPGRFGRLSARAVLVPLLSTGVLITGLSSKADAALNLDPWVGRIRENYSQARSRAATVVKQARQVSGRTMSELRSVRGKLTSPETVSSLARKGKQLRLNTGLMVVRNIPVYDHEAGRVVTLDTFMRRITRELGGDAIRGSDLEKDPVGTGFMLLMDADYLEKAKIIPGPEPGSYISIEEAKRANFRMEEMSSLESVYASTKNAYRRGDAGSLAANLRELSVQLRSVALSDDQKAYLAEIRDKGRVIFTSSVAGNPRVREVFAVRCDGSGIKQLTRRGQHSSGAHASPDGRWVYYIIQGPRFKKGYAECHSRVVRMDGTADREIGRTLYRIGASVWARDSRSLFVESHDPDTGKRLRHQVFLEGSRVVPTDTDPDELIRTSPDGAMRVRMDGDGQLHVKDLRSGAERKITNAKHKCYQATWSPDSRAILYMQWGPTSGHGDYVDAAKGLWVVKRDGAEHRKVTGLSTLCFSWGPNGSNISAHVLQKDSRGRERSVMSMLNIVTGSYAEITTQSGMWGPKWWFETAETRLATAAKQRGAAGRTVSRSRPPAAPRAPSGRETAPVPRGARASTRAAPLPKGIRLQLGGGVTMALVLIPAGEFMMGSSNSEAQRVSDEGPQHRVKITKPFYMGKYEVTQAQYERIMGKNPSKFKGTNNPVEVVSWNDATEFCRTLSQRTGKKVRLPTEAEWEYACRAGTTRPLHYGNSLSSSQANFRGDYPYGGGAKGTTRSWRKKTTSVGSFAANVWGLHDMHGNLWEWCSDRYDKGYYAKSPRQDPKGSTSGSSRVLRGGSWNSLGNMCRSASRLGCGPSNRHPSYGFRVVAFPSSGP